MKTGGGIPASKGEKEMSLEIFELSGKVAMVTGSTRGLGEVAAKALAMAGAAVAVCGRNESDMQRVSSEMRAMGRDAAGFLFDVTSRDSVRAGVDQILGHITCSPLWCLSTGLSTIRPW